MRLSVVLTVVERDSRTDEVQVELMVRLLDAE